MAKQSVHILVVEDDADHAELIQRAFEPYGDRYVLTVTGTLGQALEYLRSNSPDLVVADLLLPDGKGTDMLPREMEDRMFPLVVLTSHGNEHEAVEAMKAGALDYVVKTHSSFLDMRYIAERSLRQWRHITERRQAEEALRASEERFRAVFESAGDCIFIKDGSLRYTLVNPAMCELFGLPAPRIIGRRSEDLYGEEVGKQLADRDSRALTGEYIETEQTRPVNGQLMTFHDTIVPLRNARHEIIGICGISRNVTERNRAVRGTEFSVEDYPSKAMRNTLDKARIAAGTDSIVLLQGESGSGKDHLARWIHDHSMRAGGPFFSINCAAVSRELAESELFGHERGAFTGAVGRKRGMLELAEGGTILLNEIGELDLSLQSKLLAFLDTRSFLRVGGQKPVHVNARLVAATHRDLGTEVAQGRFLEPLFYRLSVFPIRVPALRERWDDMSALVKEIMSRLAQEMQLTEIPSIDHLHLQALCRYEWPGNVRELRNVLERSLILWRGDRLELTLPFVEGEETDTAWSYTVRYQPGRTLRDVTDEVTQRLCREVLRLCEGNKKETARLLDISRDALYRYIRGIRRWPKNKTL